ncbi:MAG: OmpP1/FadL family transporter [Hyphomicrobium sp.]
MQPTNKIARSSRHPGIVALVLFAASAEGAVAGGFGVEQSAYYQGMSFAGAAAGGPSLTSLAWNPATANFADAGLAFEMSATVVLMSAELTVTNPQDQFVTGGTGTELGRNALVGASFATWRLDSKTVLALSFTSPFGLGTKVQNPDWVGSYQGLTTSVFNLNAAPIISYEIAPGLSVAAGVQIDYFNLQRQTAATAFGTADLRADDYGVGYVLGINYAPSASTSIGLGFRSAIDHTVKGHLGISGVDEAPIKASLTLPEMLALGLRQAISPTTRLTAEAEWVNWSRFGVIPIELQGPLLGSPTGTTASNLVFNWRDGWLFAIGGEYDWSRELTLRTGVAYEISPVDGPTTRLVQDPDSNRVWASLGASYMINASTRWDFSYSHVFFEDNAPFDRVGASTQFATPHLLGTADVRMDLFSFGFKTVWGGAETAPAALK